MDSIAHGKRVEALIENVGLAIGFSEEKISQLRLFAIFHDIGKSQIPLPILYKSGPLTKEEMKIMKKHSNIGKELANNLSLVSDWILKHHERWDGNGYPLGIKGDQIPFECRLLAILDAYDAMTSDRPYQQAISHEKALQEIKRCSGTQFDPELVNLFCSVMENVKDRAG